jgi:hypothetical protein
LEIDLLRVIFSVLLIFFIPGFFLIQALFPLRNELDEEDDLLYRIALGIAFSIVITTFDGFVLGSLGVNPSTDKGYWDTPYIIGSLSVLSIVFFVIGWYRGAYPILGRKPKSEAPLKLSKKDKEKFYTIMEELKTLYQLRENLNDQLQDGFVKNILKHKTKIKDITKRIEELEAELVSMGHKEIPAIKAKS